MQNSEVTQWYNSLPNIITGKLIHETNEFLIDSSHDFFYFSDCSQDIDENEEDLHNYNHHDDGEEVLKLIKENYGVTHLYSKSGDVELVSDAEIKIAEDQDIEMKLEAKQMSNMHEDVSFVILRKLKPYKALDHDVVARLGTANEFIKVISSCGRKFLSSHSDKSNVSSEPFVSTFTYDKYGDIWFTDYYTKKQINVSDKNSNWNGFTSGGGLKNFIQALHGFILGDNHIRKSYFEISEAYPNHFWGYDKESLDKVKNKGIELSIVQ
jgi:hypothetical protein